MTALVILQELPPTVVTGIATDVTANSATLNGTVNANGLSTTAEYIYRTSGSYISSWHTSSQVVSGLGDTAISIGVNGLLPGTTYYYRIQAQNSAGISYGNEMAFTTVPEPTPSAIPVTTPTPTSIPGSLQVHYAFDEGSGTIAIDSSVNGNDGIINEATWTTGRNGSGLSFDGINSYVSVPLFNNDEISICAWFNKNTNDTTANDAIFGGFRGDPNLQLREGFELRFQPSAPDTIEFVL
ncbi:MAG: fibronectin type III domain-containing protein, partial [Candidatus Brocadia sp.]